MRKLDGKYHITEDRIVNTSTGAVVPEDEPLFLFRAKDIHAVQILSNYQGICMNDDCKPEQIAGIEREIKKFDNFRKLHPERMKQPD